MPEVEVVLDRGTWEMLEIARLQEGHDADWFIQQAIAMALDDATGLDWTQAQLCGELIADSRGVVSSRISRTQDTALTGWSEEFDIERAQLVRFLLRSYISRIPDKRPGATIDLSHLEVSNSSDLLTEVRRVLDGGPWFDKIFGNVEGYGEPVEMPWLEELFAHEPPTPPVSPKTFSYRTDDEIEKELNLQIELSKEVLFRAYVNSLKSWIAKCERDMRRLSGSNELFRSTERLTDVYLDEVESGEPHGERDRLRVWKEFVAETVRKQGIFGPNIDFRELNKEYRTWILRQINL